MTNVSQMSETDKQNFWKELAAVQFPISIPDLAKALGINPITLRSSLNHKKNEFTEGMHYILIKNSVDGLPYRFFTRKGIYKVLESRCTTKNPNADRAKAFLEYLEAHPHLGAKPEKENGLTVFKFNDNPITTLQINQQPHFMAKDVCEALDLTHVTNTLAKLDDDEKLTVKVLQSGQQRPMWFVTESGLYNLVFRSTKPEAKAFRKWVTSEVLPTLRKTGRYDIAEQRKTETAPPPPSPLLLERDNLQKLCMNVALRCKRNSAEYKLVKCLQPVLFN